MDPQKRPPWQGGVKSYDDIATEAQVWREQVTPALVRSARLEGFLCGLLTGLFFVFLLQ